MAVIFVILYASFQTIFQDNCCGLMVKVTVQFVECKIITCFDQKRIKYLDYFPLMSKITMKEHTKEMLVTKILSKTVSE